MPSRPSNSRADVKDLQRLRKIFLEAKPNQGVVDYWEDIQLLKLYDSTYARRIGWKWQAVLNELTQRQWNPPSTIKRCIDWGCGSGVASETFVNSALLGSLNELLLCDRSGRAREFAAQKLTSFKNNLTISTQNSDVLQVTSEDLVLISHVLTELNNEQRDSLQKIIRNAGAVIWVEPGTPFCANSMSIIRSQLKEIFEIVAPCPHSLECPLKNNATDWCHFFAPPPSEIFHDPFWSFFSREMQIDLRSLPVSFLVLQRNSESKRHQKPARVISRPRFYKGHAKVLLCKENGTLTEEQLPQKRWKEKFKQWQKDCFFVEVTSDQDCD